MKKETDELILCDGKKYIRLSMFQKKTTGCHKDSTGNHIIDYDESQIEISFREDDENGWGGGGGEYIAISDIHEMANCIRDVTLRKKEKSEYQCQNDTMKISLEYYTQSESYTFTVSLLQMFMRNYHISITKTNLSINELDEYIQPFFEWETKFPLSLIN